MRIALDTATDRLSVAVGTTAAESAVAHVDGARRHAASILATMERLISARGARLADVTDVVVADGPGSFTGLRVAVSVAKALAATRGIRLWTAPSLLARAAFAAHDGEVVVSVLDALRAELYSAAYLVEAGGITCVLPPAARTPEALLDAVSAPGLLVGEAQPALAGRLEGWAARTSLGGRADARALLAAMGRPGGAVRIDDPAGWEPTYGRPAEAQARWEAQHGRPLHHPPGTAG
jgi:tRNA threonylcarbamoyl adenosine modification protein YeaZ